MRDLFSMEDKIAVITGGYGHLGTAMAMALLDFGATVIIAGRDYQKFKNTFSAEQRGKLFFKKVDIMSEASIKEQFQSVVKEYGSINVLINNAFDSKGKWDDLSSDDWQYTLDGILLSVQRGMDAVLPAMKEQQCGKILNIASMYGLVSPDFSLYSSDNCEQFTNPPHYGAAKAAVIQLTRYYASQYGPHNIQVNAIAPGPFPNPTIIKSHPRFIEKLKNRNPMGAIGKPEDLAGATLLLCSSASNFITGQVLQVDGGWTIR